VKAGVSLIVDIVENLTDKGWFGVVAPSSQQGMFGIRELNCSGLA